MTKTEKEIITKEIGTLVNCAVAFEYDDGENDYTEISKDYWSRADELMSLAKEFGFRDEAQAVYDEAYRISSGANEVLRAYREAKAG